MLDIGSSGKTVILFYDDSHVWWFAVTVHWQTGGSRKVQWLAFFTIFEGTSIKWEQALLWKIISHKFFFFKRHVILNLTLSQLWNAKGDILKKCTVKKLQWIGNEAFMLQKAKITIKESTKWFIQIL